MANRDNLVSFNAETLTIAKVGTTTLTDLQNLSHDGSGVEDEKNKEDQQAILPLKKETNRGRGLKAQKFLQDAAKNENETTRYSFLYSIHL